MKKKIYLVATLTCCIGLLSACNSGNKTQEDETVVMEVADDPETEKANQKAIEELKKQQEEERNSQTTFRLDKTTHDFGPVREGSENRCTFTVTNTGNKMLVIEDVKASCGCTTPVKPEKPIAPGKSDKIEVGFKPSGKGDIEKTVTITANTDPQLTVVKVKAFVN